MSLIVDAVTHAFDSRSSNAKAGAFAQRALDSFFAFQWDFIPDPYRLEAELYYSAIDADTFVSTMFLESTTDVAVYHTIPAWGVFGDLSPIDVGIEARRRHPDRVLLYAAVSPLEGARALDELDRQAEQWGPIGLKLYPMDIIDGQLLRFRLDDPKLAYPVLERCRELGIRTVAIHKAIPLDQAPAEYFASPDVESAARDFPDLNFEVVHGGFAFLEETVLQLMRFPNIYVNLEGVASMLTKQPAAFARILGQLMVYSGHERIFWGTGATVFHPRALIEAFEGFEMPEELVTGYGYPRLTAEVKADILGGNYLRVQGLDRTALEARLSVDAVALERARGLREPWSVLRDGAIR
jgi:predicted TIM-barrel fold metal-dependent hydrolase